MVAATLGLKCPSSKAGAGAFTVKHYLPIKSLLNVHVLHTSFIEHLVAEYSFSHFHCLKLLSTTDVFQPPYLAFFLDF